MIFRPFSAATGLLLALGLSSKVANVEAFDGKQCSVYVFRSEEGALWHCGEKLPEVSFNHSLYCDHAQGDYLIDPKTNLETTNFAWAPFVPDDWCDFLISTVRVKDEDVYALTKDQNITITDTPGPNPGEFSKILDWGCYVVDPVTKTTTESYLVDSRNGFHASTTTEQCNRTMSYFDYGEMHSAIKDLNWWGHVPSTDYEPVKKYFDQRCHYDDVVNSAHYDKQLGIEYAECRPGLVCELKMKGYAKCFPDPHADHECCISWHNKCKNVGDCCAGSECNSNGYCDVYMEMVNEKPPGICENTTTTALTKTDRKLYNRCYNVTEVSEKVFLQGDCAPGYLCEGNSWYAGCVVDKSVKTNCCKWNWEANARPGDCCVGWMAHCHNSDPVTGVCTNSQCVPGRETGVNELGDSMLDVHDRMCREPPSKATFNEQIYDCKGAVCGLWGDPHIVTCDDLHYDCQAVGLFTIMKNHMFNIQGNFIYLETPWGGASITNDLAIDYLKDSSTDANAIPTMQFSFPDFEVLDKANPVYDAKSRVIGLCPVLFYLDGVLHDINKVPDSGFLVGDATTDYSVKLTRFNQIDIRHLGGTDADGEKYYSNSVIWIQGSGPFAQFSCIMTYFICLPGQDEEQFKTSSVGLLGTPNQSTKDDWMAVDGQTLVIPTTDRIKAAHNYCVDNWCVNNETDSVITYAEGLTFDDYKCVPQVYHEFDVEKCLNTEAVVERCKNQYQKVTCQMETCAMNDEAEKEIKETEELKKLKEEEENNINEFPDVTVEYGDCANLGAGLSASTGNGAYSLTYPQQGSIFANATSFSIGHDNSVSVLVGGNFNCKTGSGFEGRGVFLGDMTLEQGGCDRLAATVHGSLIHPLDNSVCVEVAGDLSIASSFMNQKYIMHEDGNAGKACHLMYKAGCTVNGAACPTNRTDLEDHFVNTNGDFKKDTALNVTRWEKELTLLKQKTNYWKTLTANGNVTTKDGVLEFRVGDDKNSVQIFKIPPIADSVTNVAFQKGLLGKTVMIIVDGDGDFNVPPMCYQPADAGEGQAYVCGTDTFPSTLSASIAWVFPTKNTVTIKGQDELQGSVIIPMGSLVFKTSGHSGRMLVGGDLTIDGEFAELHNYEFDPVAQPLPLGDDLKTICEIAPPPPCNETLKPLTSKTACPSRKEGIVKLIKSTVPIPANEPVLYDIIIEDPKDLASAKTVKFKVDNPFTNFTDIYVKHVKKVGKYAMDPVCQTMPFTPGCNKEAKEIEVGCHEYEGVAPFALVSIYFASNTDSAVVDLGAGKGVVIDKCCKPPTEYATKGYGIIEYTFEIQCSCPSIAVDN